MAGKDGFMKKDRLLGSSEMERGCRGKRGAFWKPMLMIHGNVSSNRMQEEKMQRLQPRKWLLYMSVFLTQNVKDPVFPS